MAVFFMTKMRDIFLLWRFFAEVQGKIRGKADEYSACRFDPKNGENAGDRSLLRKHNREHFIRGGQKNGNQGANRNHAARI